MGNSTSGLLSCKIPELNRAITFLRISPQRDDPTRVDCELEVTQWFRPEIEEEPVVAE